MPLIYLIFISFPLQLFISFISSFVLFTILPFIAIIESPSFISIFSYGLYVAPSMLSIPDVPTTKTPLVYNFIPTTSPTGITCISDIFTSSPFTAIVIGA